MIRGSCLCGGVTFEVARVVGPFELCHCSRCRKASGSAFDARVGVMREDLRLLQGLELIKSYAAPVRETPPPYRIWFCGRCGSPLPDVASTSAWLEIPAGLFDDDPALRPDKHIYVDTKSAWFTIADALPQFDKAAIRRHRQTNPRPT